MTSVSRPQPFTLNSLRKHLVAALSELARLHSFLDLPASERDCAVEPGKQWLAVIDAMTAAERSKPSLIDDRRTLRIAAGAGVAPDVVRTLLEYYMAVEPLIQRA